MAALPPSTDFTGAAVTEGGFKTAITGLRDYLSGLLGTTGVPADALAALGANPFPSGTLMLFQQTAAPTGWTKDTTHNNKALRVVSGTASSGGSVAFTTAFGGTTTGSTTLSSSQIPAHTHGQMVNGSAVYKQSLGSATKSVLPPADSDVTADSAAAADVTGSTGGGAGHTHPLDLRVQYVDLIIASKD